MNEETPSGPPPEKLDSKLLVRVPCKACGGEMNYDAGKEALFCANCSNTQAVPTGQDLIIERSITEALNLADSESGMGVAVKSFSCKNCGATELVSSDQPVLVCSFCASENVNSTAFDQKVIRPAGILPFQVEKKKAGEIFREWIGSGWFRPNGLKKVRDVSKLDGMYIPFWTYDAQTDSSWTAEAGYYYYVNVQYTDENGNTQTRQEQRVRWEYCSGYYEHFFDDVLVVGSKGVHQNRMEQIFPFSLEKVVNYDPQFMLGWKAEVYRTDVKEGLNMAEQIMDQFIYSECGRMVPGDTFRNLNVNTQKYNITFKHILLPVWIAAYQFDGKVFQVVINGQTGIISGEKPWSFWKIALAVVAFIILAAIIFALTKK